MDSHVEQEIKVMPSKQLQAKLTTSQSGKSTEQLVAQIRDAFKLGEFLIEPAGSEVIEDEYFDTRELSLHACQSSVRLRRVDGTICLTLKKMRGHDPGLLDREEIKETLTETAARELVAKGFAGIMREHFSDLGDKARLDAVVRIRNRRQNFSLSRRDEKYQMSVDQFRCESPAQATNGEEHFEIEIEALNVAARSHLPSIKRNLRSAVDLTYSDLSKYERAINEVRSVHAARLTPVAEATPQTLQGGIMREVWSLKPGWRRLVLIAGILVAVAFAIWTSIPDSTKERLLGEPAAAEIPKPQAPR